MLPIPDLLSYWLTGHARAERTNASTTGLLDAHSSEWNASLIRQLGFPSAIFPELIRPGEQLGPVLPSVAREIGAGPELQVTAVGSHDTASAVAAIPATTEDFAYVSCGTWSLVGVELEHPVLTEQGRSAGFTNERGVDGRIRYLHNIMGLWLLEESIREWETGGERVDRQSLLHVAAEVSGPVAVFDSDDPRLLAPGDMPERIARLCAEGGSEPPRTRAETVRSILESLAMSTARTLNQARALTGASIAVVHLVGGGARNELLCQLTADHTGLPLYAGPAEASSIGNILVQARSAGFVSGSLESLRALVAHSFPPQLYLPRAIRRPRTESRMVLP